MSNTRLLKTRTVLKDPVPIAVGLTLSVFWGLHAAAPSIPPGKGYVRICLLFCVVLAALACRRSIPTVKDSAGSKNLIVLGLCSWLVAATLSAMLNWQASLDETLRLRRDLAVLKNQGDR
jgi:hypothetical protein